MRHELAKGDNMWVEAIAIGLIVGLLRGGRFSNLANFSLRGVLVLVIGLILQLAPFFLHGVPFVKDNAALFSFVGLLFAAVFIALNIKVSGMPLVLIGVALNAVVMLFHNFKMPIQLADATSAKFVQMKLSIASGAVSNYMLLSDSTHISKYLGKLWLMPSYYPFTKYFGIPDIIIAIGVIWLLQTALENKFADYARGTYYRSFKNR